MVTFHSYVNLMKHPREGDSNGVTLSKKILQDVE